MKVVINKSFGGFQLSQKALDLYNEITGKNQTDPFNFDRTDSALIQVVEALGEEAEDDCWIEIVDIPDGVEWEMRNYDGQESIHEVHRSWA